MSFQTFVGSITQPLSTTGNQAKTGVGFQPKAILFFGTDKTAAGSAINLVSYLGMATSSSNRAAQSTVCTSSTTDDRYADDTKCLVVATVAGVVLSAADFVSFDADGFTINWTTCDAIQRITNFIAFGGTDLTNVLMKEFNQSASTGAQAITGVGFQPSSIITMSHSTTTGLPGGGGGDTNSGGDLLFGVTDGTTSKAYGADIADSVLKTDFIVRPSGGNLSTLRYEASFTSMDSDGFTMNWLSASSRTVFALCLKGGSYKVGAINQATGTGTQATTGVGFTPTGLILFSQGATSTTSVQQLGRRISLGAGSSSSARGLIWNGTDNTNLNQNLDLSNIYKAMTPGAAGSPTLVAAANLTSLDSDGFTLNYGTADATAREIIYMAFGNTPVVTASGSTLLMMGV